jgi:hypothetical protein
MKGYQANDRLLSDKGLDDVHRIYLRGECLAFTQSADTEDRLVDVGAVQIAGR